MPTRRSKKLKKDPRDIWLGATREKNISDLQGLMDRETNPKQKTVLARLARAERHGAAGFGNARATFEFGVGQLRIPRIGVF